MVSKDMVDVLAKRINPKRYHIINNSGHSKELIEIALSELRQ
jgi:hypothetical protein